jgi:hypothetical protein
MEMPELTQNMVPCIFCRAVPAEDDSEMQEVCWLRLLHVSGAAYRPLHTVPVVIALVICNDFRILANLSRPAA